MATGEPSKRHSSSQTCSIIWVMERIIWETSTYPQSSSVIAKHDASGREGDTIRTGGEVHRIYSLNELSVSTGSWHEKPGR